MVAFHPADRISPDASETLRNSAPDRHDWQRRQRPVCPILRCNMAISACSSWRMVLSAWPTIRATSLPIKFLAPLSAFGEIQRIGQISVLFPSSPFDLGSDLRPDQGNFAADRIAGRRFDGNFDLLTLISVKMQGARPAVASQPYLPRAPLPRFFHSIQSRPQVKAQPKRTPWRSRMIMNPIRGSRRLSDRLIISPASHPNSPELK